MPVYKFRYRVKVGCRTGMMTARDKLRKAGFKTYGGWELPTGFPGAYCRRTDMEILVHRNMGLGWNYNGPDTYRGIPYISLDELILRRLWLT